jgi:hypothetical protein
LTARRERLTLLVSGMMAGVPFQGGASWAMLQYVLGLARLGHEVVFVEPVERTVLQPAGTSLAESRSAAYARRHLVPLLGSDRFALLLAGTRETLGVSYAELEEYARRADVLINISGMLADDRLLDAVPLRLFLDLDPGFTQVWHETGEGKSFDAHTHFATIGRAIGKDGCPVPTCGRTWIPTLPPVVLERWPPAGRPVRDAFTTVGHWRSYGSIEHNGLAYGQRAHSFRGLIELPGRTAANLELALAIHPDELRDLEALAANGWKLVDPDRAAGTPARYREFIRASKGELSVAKSGYVTPRSGWFSDRSACYLASGRPVVAQETGFCEYLPTGEGLLAFESVDEAAAALATVEEDWELHGGAARALAEEHLDSDRVLSGLLRRVGA